MYGACNRATYGILDYKEDHRKPLQGMQIRFLRRK